MRDKIFRYFEGSISPADRESFFSELNSSEEAKRQYIEIKNFLTEREILTSKTDKREIKQALRSIHERAGILHVSDKYSFNRGFLRLSYLSIVAILLFAAGYLSYRHFRNVQESKSIEYLANIDTDDSNSEVDLLLSNGKTIRIDNVSEPADINNNDVTINAKGNVISIKNNSSEGAVNTGKVIDVMKTEKAAQKLNYLIVRGKKEFVLELPDGSKICMKQNAKIGFPDKFSSDVRSVEFEGEGYFEIASDESYPFIINANGIMAKVVGTEFNLKTSTDDSLLEISMTSGKMLVSDKGMPEITLTKNMQLIVSKLDGTYEINEIDSYRYRAWRDGYFVFINDSLSQILERLSEWYDLDIVLKTDKYNGYKFNGKFRRDTKLDKIISLLQDSYDFHFWIDDDRLYIE